MVNDCKSTMELTCGIHGHIDRGIFRGIVSGAAEKSLAVADSS